MTKRKIAIVTQDLSIVTGVSTVVKFLQGVISRSSNYQAELISLATSARDQNSVQITNPSTWARGVTVSNKTFSDLQYRHVGSHWAEIEFFRYRPRLALDKILSEFDLVQVIAGTPPWVLPAKNFAGKIALQVATLTATERQSSINLTPQPKRLWVKAMTKWSESLEPLAFARADAIFVENNWLQKHLSHEYSGKTVFAPPGVDTNFFQPKEYQKDGYLLAVGRFADRRKNVRLLFEAYRLVLDKLPNVPKLILAGQTAPTAREMARATELRILDKIEILTEVSQDRLLELYQNASLFVLSSDEEGFGLVIAEAMACGVPVVATNCGGPEVLVEDGRTGFLTPINDPVAMSERIADLLKDPDKRQFFSAAARKRASKKFSLAATGRVYLETYDQLFNQ